MRIRPSRPAGGPDETSFVRFAYRPFDTRWVYWEGRDGLLDRPRPEYRHHVFDENLWLVFQNKARPDLSPPLAIRHLGDVNQMNSSAYCIPALLYDDSLATALKQKPHRPNLTATAQSYLERLDADALDLVHHVIAVLHEPAYNQANADALRAEGPRIPLAGWSDNRDKSAAAALGRSAARGRELLQLLDPEVPISGVTDGTLRDEIATVAVPTTARERNMTGEDFAITAGWGHYGASAVVMPGRGRAIEREYTAAEHTKFGEAGAVLGRTTVGRRLPERQRVLAQRASRCLEVQARRPPSAEEVAVLPGTWSPGPRADAPRSAGVDENRSADLGDTDDAIKGPRTRRDHRKLGKSPPSRGRATPSTTPTRR